PAPGAGTRVLLQEELRRFARRNRGQHSGRKDFAALGAATSQDLATVGGLHARTEAVVTLALEVAGLVGALGSHGGDALAVARLTEPAILRGGGRPGQGRARRERGRATSPGAAVVVWPSSRHLACGP